MATLREIKRKAKRKLHDIMLVPALYLLPNPVGSPSPYQDPVPVNVRVHSKFKLNGDQVGTNFNSAERHEDIPQIVFDRFQISMPARGAVISIEQGEAYRIDNVKPSDDDFITARCTRLRLAETVGLPLPEGRAPDGAEGGYYTDDNLISSYQTED